MFLHIYGREAIRTGEGGLVILPFFSSIRRNLALLVLVSMAPALVIVLFTGRALHEAMVRSAENAALRQIQAMSAHHEHVVDSARLLLATLAKSREVRLGSPREAQQLLEEILARNGAYCALALADAAGRIVAVSPPGSLSSIENEGYFQESVAGMRFTMGAYHLAPGPSRRVVIEFAQPVSAPDGSVHGVLVASFDLNYFGRVFADAHLPEGSVFTLTDAAGMRLTRFPETEKYTWVPDLPQMIERMSGERAEGVFLETGVDGVRRLYSFKRMYFMDTPSRHLMIRLGQPEDLALAKARSAVYRNAVLLALAAVLAAIGAWFVGEFIIMRRVNRLMAAADRLGSGDLSTRTGLEREGGEMGRLAAAFNRMAESLEDQDRERRRAEEELCILNTELEDRVSRRTGELARANAELQAALDDLRQAQSQLVMAEKLAALGGLVAGVAHEINTPVGVALSASSTLAEKTRNIRELFETGGMRRSDLTAYLDSAREGVEMGVLNLHRASELIRSFKMVAADQVSEVRRRFMVREYVEEILLSLRPKLKKTALRVEVECDAELCIDSYPGAFSQILTNFVINSLTHAFDEGQAGVIRIAVRMDGAALVLSYSDDGRGIPPEAQDKIFDPFYTSARSRGSTGLGLHIVFNVVTRTLNGSVTCCSEPGHGTTFVVRFPCEEAGHDGQ